MLGVGVMVVRMMTAMRIVWMMMAGTLMITMMVAMILLIVTMISMVVVMMMMVVVMCSWCWGGCLIQRDIHESPRHFLPTTTYSRFRMACFSFRLPPLPLLAAPTHVLGTNYFKLEWDHFCSV